MPGAAVYYETLRAIFDVESKILTAILPHKGERGRNDEERVRAFLVKILPKRFSIGTGFIISSAPLMPSRQTDIVIFDEISNVPLHREFAAFVFPIEIVYATVEVKAMLNKSELVKTLKSIAMVRKLAEHKQYVAYGSVAPDPDRPEQLVVATGEYSTNAAPRAYIVAYDASWKTFDSFQKSFRDALMEVPGAHVHGLLVLSKDWFSTQEAFTKEERRVQGVTKDSMLAFIQTMTMGISSFQMGQANIDRYLTSVESIADVPPARVRE